MWGLREGVGWVDRVLPGRSLTPTTQDPIQGVRDRVKVVGEAIIMQVVILIFANLDEVAAWVHSYLGRDGCLAHKGRCPCEYFLVCEVVSEILDLVVRSRMPKRRRGHAQTDAPGGASANEWRPGASAVFSQRSNLKAK